MREIKVGAVLQAKIRYTTLATILKYLEKQGIFVSSRAALLETGIEMFKDVLVGSGSVEEVKNPEEALVILTQAGLPGLSKRDKGAGFSAEVLEYQKRLDSLGKYKAESGEEGESEIELYERIRRERDSL